MFFFSKLTLVRDVRLSLFLLQLKIQNVVALTRLTAVKLFYLTNGIKDNHMRLQGNILVECRMKRDREK